MDIIEDKVNLLFEPSEKQAQFIDAVFSGDYLYTLFGGSIRGGKTFCGLATLMLLCKRYPGSRWAIVRDTLPTLKRNTIPSFWKLFPDTFVKSYNQDTQVVRMVNGSEILFFAENYNDDKELNRWKGLEVNGFLLEECNELQEVSFYKAIERAGTHIPRNGDKPLPIIMMTCNPSQNWVKQLFYDRWRDGVLPPKWLYIPCKITDNPYIMADTAYVESLRSMPRYEYEVYVEGNWDLMLKSGGEFYKGFDLERNVGVFKYDPELALHISWDDNVNPYLPVGVFQIDGGRVMMVDEVLGRSPNNTVRWVCDEIKRRYGGHKAGMFVYGDATSNKKDTKLEDGYNFYRLIIDYLSIFRPQLRVLRSNPAVVQRGAWINSIMEGKVRDISFVVDEGCKTAISDFIGTKEAADGTKLKNMVIDAATKVRYQQYGHITDLTDYLLCSAFSANFAKWQRGSVMGRITTGRNVSKNIY